jgi:hypothetical protein
MLCRRFFVLRWCCSVGGAVRFIDVLLCSVDGPALLAEVALKLWKLCRCCFGDVDAAKVVLCAFELTLSG